VFQNNTWYGIAHYNSTSGNISGNVASNNSLNGISLTLAVSTVAEGNSVYGNVNGISLSALSTPANVAVRSNVVEFNSQNGVIFIGFDGGNPQGYNITSNTIRNNSRDGILMYQSEDNALEYNTIYGNAYNGIQLFNRSFNTSVVGNNISFNLRAGIFLNYSNYSNIRGNNLSLNSQNGLYVRDSHHNTIEGNFIYGHNATGYSSIYNTRANYNNYTGNTWDEDYFGIFCDYCNYTNVINNTATRHAREGIRFDSGLETVITIHNANITGNYVDNAGDNCMQYGTAVDGTVAHNRGYNCYDGYHIRGNSHNNIIINNTGANFINNGMDLQGTWNNTVAGNNMTNYSTSPLILNVWYPNVNSTYCDNLVENNTGDLGLPVYYSNETGTYNGGEYAYFAICGGPNSVIENITLTGLSSDRRNSYMQVVFSENSVIRNVAITNSYAIEVADSNNSTIANISMANTEWGLSVLWQNNTLVENVTISDMLYSGLYAVASTNGTYRNFLMGGGNAHYGAIFLGNDTINLTDNTMHNVTVYSVPNYAYTYPVSVDVDNFLTALTLCKDNPSSSSAGCIKFDRLNITNANLTNNTNIILADDFVSINSSDGNASQFNSSANITLAADCSPGIIYNIYMKEDFPSTAADIIANGTLYTPTRMACSNDYFTFGVTSFSGYALEEGTLNLTIYPSTDVLPHVPTNASCDSSNPSVMLELYRNDVLVANGTSHVEDASNLTAGTYNYVCNTTNYSSAYATGTLRVRASNVGGSSSPVGISISGEEVVGNTLTITVRDGSTPVDGAEVRVLYWSNGMLNAINLGNTDSRGEVEFTPALAGEYTVEATTAGYGAVEFAFSVEAAEVQEETGSGMPGTGCGNGCPAGYGCINVQCVRIGGQQEAPADGGTGGILPVVASPAWESTEDSPADREVSSTPAQQGAAQDEGNGEPASQLVLLVPLALAAALVFLMLRRKHNA
jgi:parallel beta-helix repeat protein